MNTHHTHETSVVSNEGFIDTILDKLRPSSNTSEEKRPPCKKSSKGGYFQSIRLRRKILEFLRSKYPKIAKAIETPLSIGDEINEWYDVGFEDVPDDDEGSYDLISFNFRKLRSLPSEEFDYIIGEQFWEATAKIKNSLPSNVYLSVDAGGDDIGYRIYFKK